jgi:phosphate starvation-inducible protein PhoH
MSKKEQVSLSRLSTKDFPLIKKLDWEQEDMVNKLYKSRRVMVDSIAGAGKTTVLTQAMKVLLDKDHIDTIYYVVFPVQEDSLGHLPGGVSDKIKEYVVPFYQALVSAGVNPQQIDLDRMTDEFIPYPYKVVPHTFLRGRTLENVGVIVDEVQNGTVDELQKTLTRIADDCYVGIVGHTGQTDIPNSGFPAYIHHFKRGKETGIYTDMEFAKLTTNYRGKFSSFVDQINKSFKEENSE